MSDPLGQIVGMLSPRLSRSKLVVAHGEWSVWRRQTTNPFYLLVLEGSCQIGDVGGPIVIGRGELVLIPAAKTFTVSHSGARANEPESIRTVLAPGRIRLGRVDRTETARLLVGHCVFDSADKELLTSLLPQFIHVAGNETLRSLAHLIDEEARSDMPARDLILTRMAEVLFIGALRSGISIDASPGLLRGLANPRLASALRAMHSDLGGDWSTDRLARTAGMSRSIFFENFRRLVGRTPMNHLLQWRMKQAKTDLANDQPISEVARRAGYASASSFSTAFKRSEGVPPANFRR